MAMRAEGQPLARTDASSGLAHSFTSSNGDLSDDDGNILKLISVV